MYRVPDHNDNWPYFLSVLVEHCAPPQIENFKESLDENIAKIFIEDNDFIILSPTLRDKKSGLFILFAYAESGNAIEKHLPEIKQIANNFKAEFIEFWTQREGFEKVAPKHNFEKAHTIWRLTL